MAAAPRDLGKRFLQAGLTLFWLVAALGTVEDPLYGGLLVASCALLSVCLLERSGPESHARTAALLTVQALVVWVLLAESLFFLEETFQFNISRRLDIGPRIQRQARQALSKTAMDHFEQPTADRLFYRRTPGSEHRRKYDVDSAPQYKTTVDETGYLNLNRGFYAARPRIDVFISGDSVLQGEGMPSALEKLKGRLPCSLWNLSTGSYDAHEKVTALLRYGLPKRPKLLVVEFYSGNDASEINEDLMLGASGSYEERFAIPSLYRRMLESPAYRPLLNPPPGGKPGAPARPSLASALEDRVSGFLFACRSESLTLALTHHVASRTRWWFEDLFPDKDPPLPDKHPVVLPAYAHFDVKPERYDDWMRLGLDATLGEYARLLREARRAEEPPLVAVLYNPTSYEIYRGTLALPHRAGDHRAELQRRALEGFCRTNGVPFIDLLPGFRKRTAGRPTPWLYGKIEPIHWSPRGTAMAADVLEEALAPLWPKLRTRYR